eukprot:SAG11_NODE_1225_length_5476_cov_7.465129_2_plen_209_part_00
MNVGLLNLVEPGKMLIINLDTPDTTILTLSNPYRIVTRIAQHVRSDSKPNPRGSMPNTGTTTRSKSKTPKSSTAAGTPVGSRTCTDGCVVQIPAWASTAKIDQLEDLVIDSSDDELNDGQEKEEKVESPKKDKFDTPGAAATTRRDRGHRRAHRPQGARLLFSLVPAYLLNFSSGEATPGRTSCARGLSGGPCDHESHLGCPCGPCGP